MTEQTITGFTRALIWDECQHNTNWLYKLSIMPLKTLWWGNNEMFWDFPQCIFLIWLYCMSNIDKNKTPIPSIRNIITGIFYLVSGIMSSLTYRTSTSWLHWKGAGQVIKLNIPWKPHWLNLWHLWWYLWKIKMT